MLNRCVWAAVLVSGVPVFAGPATLKLDFSSGPVGKGMTRVLPASPTRSSQRPLGN